MCLAPQDPIQWMINRHNQKETGDIAIEEQKKPSMICNLFGICSSDEPVNNERTFGDEPNKNEIRKKCFPLCHNGKCVLSMDCYSAILTNVNNDK